MRRAVLAIVLAVFFSAVSASSVPNRTVNSANTSAQAQMQATLQPVSSNVDVAVVASVQRLPPNSTDGATVKNDSDWRDYGMLFATLALMAVIAVRRQRR